MTPAHDATQEVEDDRLRLVAKMVEDSGTEWADGFRPGTSGCHELLDRTQLVSDMLERHLLTHPACIAEAEWYALADAAASALRELYQRVGAEHLAAEDVVATDEQNRSASNPKQPVGKSSAKSNRTEKQTVENKDVEMVAIWLHGAARDAGHQDLFRNIIRRAANEAAEMYSLQTDHATMEDDEVGDGFGVRDAIARFAEQWDKCERTAREDEASA